MTTGTDGAAGALPSTDAIARAAYLIYRNRVDNGLPGDSLNAVTEAIRTEESLEWVHVRHEETAPRPR